MAVSNDRYVNRGAHMVPFALLTKGFIMACKKLLFIPLLVAIGSSVAVTSAIAGPSLWVSADRVERHTCPSDKCGVVGNLMFREGVEVFEAKGSWVRITKPYSASCTNGTSEYVKSGKDTCDPANGIKNGLFAEWVSTASLHKARPSDPGEGASGDDALVSQSDDYGRYRSQFSKAARQMIDEGTCTAADFEEMGGWMASPNRGVGVYFTYCGGMKTSNRLYLDVATGKVSR